ncbi:MAG: glycosyltransferase family 4 protein [Paraclostridium sordellii]|uniref:glycosyltransferase family 4 protein n=1 Tax=Paraclostridium sordellii TaxID=1505 RepID=UPI0005DA9631|nr:glycosyltransferase family 4 protein [Paeniclostridium sordellii]CEN21874.1 group 1 glycosyl transferase [[Clostridium] sordellii] [Paeniclostridium sordellii]CEP88060.1 group 1 glycosyl transferase [[Clostridium] sordellii] [Paeniclostridium sordellii]
MKILVVSQYFWPEEFRINDICQGLVEEGHEVEVLTGMPNYPGGEYFKGFSFFKRGEKEYKGIKIRRCFCIPRGKNSKLKLILNYLSFAISSLFHIPFLIKNKYDKVFVYQLSPITMAIPGILIKKIKKIPMDIYILDLWPESLLSTVNIKSNKVRKIMFYLCKKIYKSANLIYITSKGFKNKLLSYGIESGQIIYLPQWAEDIYKDKSIENDSETKFISKSKFNILFAGNIGKAQSIDTIIQAANLCKKNNNIQWIIVGDGSEKISSEQTVEQLGLTENVCFIGRKPLSHMPKYYNAADALLVTLGEDELFKITVPAKVQSYMASGKPILGAISGEGYNVIKESNCGLVCEAKDYIGLAKIAQQMYDMDILDREKFGDNGLKYFKDNFDRNILLKKINYLLQEGCKEEEYVQG